MGWFAGATSNVVHDKPLSHGGTRYGLLAGRAGYGAGAFGGRFGPEVIVQNANDTGAGSLRTILAATTPQWVTFKPNQAGIRLQSLVDVHANTTIDGRGTTPGDATAGTGFYLENYSLRCTGSNEIIHNITIDFSQWWEGWNIYGLGNGPQPIQGGGTRWRGTWAAGTAYGFTTTTDADRVYYGGLVYIATASGTGHQPDISPSFWQLAAGTAVNGQVYIGSGSSSIQGNHNFWYDHISFKGVHYGDGTPPKSTSIWDYCDGGIAFGNQEKYITISNCEFIDMNKSAIFGFGSTSANSWGDWSTMHHNYFLRGIQRQPLIRFSHVHVYANWYKDTGILGQTRGGAIDADDGTEVIYEGNLSESSRQQPNALAWSRWEKGAITSPNYPFPAGRILGHDRGNAALPNTFLDPDGAADGSAVTFSPNYSYSLPNLTGTTNQQNFRDLISQNVGHQ